MRDEEFNEIMPVENGKLQEKKQLKDKMEAISKKVDKVAADANVLTVMIAKQLKSLVLKPD